MKVCRAKYVLNSKVQYKYVRGLRCSFVYANNYLYKPFNGHKCLTHVSFEQLAIESPTRYNDLRYVPKLSQALLASSL